MGGLLHLGKFPPVNHWINDSSSRKPTLLTRLRFQVLAITFTRIILNTMHRMVYPFLPAFGRGLGVDLPVLSLAITVRSGLGTLVPFFAFIADNRGRKAGMITGLIFYSLGTLIVVFMPTFAAFVVTLCFTMLGKYIFDPAMQAYLGDRVAYQRRGLVVAVTELGWSLSFVFGIEPKSGWKGSLG